MAMTSIYNYKCVCDCGFQMEISPRRELDFDVMCLKNDCDLIMATTLESIKPIDDSLFEAQVDFE